MTVENFNSWNLTKRARIVLEHGKWLGDMSNGDGVYQLEDFWVIVDEDYEGKGNLPSFVCVKSATAVYIKPEITDPFDEDDEIRINKNPE